MAYLKGNYGLKKRIEDDALVGDEAVKTFEQFARQRLGGSIAFVMKEKTFLWAGKDSSTHKPSGCP